MSRLQTEIRITNTAFIRRINEYQDATGERAATKVVERLAAERLAQLELSKPVTAQSAGQGSAVTNEGTKLPRPAD